jgi:hypothetical protein
MALGFFLLVNSVKNSRKLQKAKKGRKIRHSMGKIRGKFSSLRIKKVAKNSPGLFSFSKQWSKKPKMSKITKSWRKKVKLKII